MENRLVCASATLELPDGLHQRSGTESDGHLELWVRVYPSEAAIYARRAIYQSPELGNYHRQPEILLGTWYGPTCLLTTKHVPDGTRLPVKLQFQNASSTVFRNRDTWRPLFDTFYVEINTNSGHLTLPSKPSGSELEVEVKCEVFLPAPSFGAYEEGGPGSLWVSEPVAY